MTKEICEIGQQVYNMRDRWNKTLPSGDPWPNGVQLIRMGHLIWNEKEKFDHWWQCESTGTNKHYKDLFSFDSSQVKCLGLIKNLCVSLVQYPAKTILMDIVVADIPPKYGMLLSRSWGAKLQGSLQLDMSYATISVFRHPKKFYIETPMKYVVSTQERPQNFPIYSMHFDIDFFILYNAESNRENNSTTLWSRILISL